MQELGRPTVVESQMKSDDSYAGPHGALLVFGDLMSHSGILSGTSIANELLSRNEWFTKKSSLLTAELPVLLYQARHGFVATAVVASTEATQRCQIQGVFLARFSLRIELRNVERFSSPLLPASLATSLSFVRKPATWGAYFRTSPRLIPIEDFRTILEAARRQK